MTAANSVMPVKVKPFHSYQIVV